MSKKKIKLEEIGNVNPFQTPEGYFENFAENMISRLPDRVSDRPQTVSLWTRMQPLVYLAAMFAGLALLIRLFVGSPDSIFRSSNGLNLSSSNEIEDFYDYYEDQFVKSYYDEAFYVAFDDSDWTED